jgi:hypothetical protein
MTPRQLFVWTTDNIMNMNVVYVCQEEIMENGRMLRSRLEEARPIAGTQTFHTSFQVISRTRNKLIIEKFSKDTTSEVQETNIPQETLSLEGITDFETCVYSDAWWLGCVMSVNLRRKFWSVSYTPKGHLHHMRILTSQTYIIFQKNKFSLRSIHALQLGELTL